MFTFTMDDAHTFAQGLIANGWLNADPNCIDTLHRQLLAITTPPAGYELAPSTATLAMQVAAQACGVNAGSSFAKCYRAMLDAQPRAASPGVAMSPEVLHAWLASEICTCPSGDGSLRWPCPSHTPEHLADKSLRKRIVVTPCASSMTRPDPNLPTTTRMPDNLDSVRQGLRQALEAARIKQNTTTDAPKE